MCHFDDSYEYTQKSYSSNKFMLIPDILDRVGPIDNRPSTDKLCHFVRKKQSDMGHVTCDRLHMTCNTWHMTHEMLVGGKVNILSKFSSLALTVCDLWYYEDLEEKADLLTHWINELITRLFIEQPQLHRVF